MGVKELLQNNGIDFEEKLIDEDPVARDYMLNVLKADNIPVTVIGDKVFVGFKRNIEAIRKELGIQ